jgi:hypothetical protein
MRAGAFSTPHLTASGLCHLCIHLHLTLVAVRKHVPVSSRQLLRRRDKLGRDLCRASRHFARHHQGVGIIRNPRNTGGAARQLVRRNILEYVRNSDPSLLAIQAARRWPHGGGRAAAGSAMLACRKAALADSGETSSRAKMACRCSTGVPDGQGWWMSMRWCARQSFTIATAERWCRERAACR